MPQIVGTFNPNAPGPLQQFSTNLPNGYGRMVMWNASNVQMTIQYGAMIDFCPAWTGMLYHLDQGAVLINWQVHSTLISNGNPISLVTIITYNDDETVPSNFPVPLQYQTNIGNPGAVSNSSSNIINDGSVAGTQIIESTPTGAGSSTISVQNDGTIQVLGDQLGTLTTLLSTVPGAAAGAASVLLGDANRRVEVLGNLKVDGPALNALTTPFTTQNGSISGTATFYMDMRGTVGRLIVVFSNFQQGVPQLAQVIIPSAFTAGAQYLAGNVPGMVIYQGGGGAQTLNEANGFQSFHTTTSIHSFTWGDIPQAFNRLAIFSNTPVACNGIMTITGI